MTANMMHLLRLTFRFQLSSWKTICVSPFASSRVGHARSINAVTFHPHAQRNAFHRDARQESRSFARWNPRHVGDLVSSIPDYFQVYGTRKNFPVYGSLTTDPDAKSLTSTYFPSSGV